jgi:hypothetical protein
MENQYFLDGDRKIIISHLHFFDVNIFFIFLTFQKCLHVSDDFIEKVLLRNKFRVERTKQKLDNYYSLRGHFKDLFQNMENIIPSQEVP